MTVFKVAFLFLFSGVVFAAPSSILKLPHQSFKLSNGLQVHLVKYPSPGVVAYQIPVHAGSRNEIEAGKTGFAHFFEHLMFRGTKKRTGKELGELYAKIGCENNAWTWYDMTNYHGVVATKYLPLILEAEADRFQNLSFDEKMLRDEAGAVLGEYNKNIAQPENILEEKLLALAFTKHTYGHTTMGYKDDILKFTERYQDVWPFFQRHYRPENVSIVLVGDIDFDKQKAEIQKLFSGWNPPKIPAQTVITEPTQLKKRSGEESLDKDMQPRVAVSYKTPAFSTKSKDSASLLLIAELLFSVTSDFQKTYRFEKKWLDSVSAVSEETIFPMLSIDPGVWVILLRTSDAGRAHSKDLIAAVEQTIEDFTKKGVTEARLAQTKRRFRNAALTGWFSSPEALASKVAVMTNFENDLGVLDRFLETIAETSAKDLQNFAKKYLISARETTFVLKGKN